LGFWAAVHFLTTIPAPLRADLPQDTWGKSMAYFPLVGFLLGASLVVGNFLFREIWPPAVASACVLGLWVILTGALHLDGFADCCDGLLVAKPADERLRILRDPHVGTFGIVGVAVLLLVKYVCLSASQADPALMVQGLILSPVLSRWVMVCATVIYPYGRQGQSLGQTFASHVTRRSLQVSSLTALILSILVGGWLGLAALVLVGLVGFAVAQWVMTRLPGLTGDVYGAINELCEVAVLLLIVALMR
jgi:adenosylcobinamide-GDP ribazoletransferase